jgi:hypothetical protein
MQFNIFVTTQTDGFINGTVFWVLTSYSSETARRFGRTCHLQIHGQKLSQETSKNRRKSACFRLFLTWLPLWPWRWSQYIPPKRRTFSELPCITNQSTLHISYLRVKLKSYKRGHDAFEVITALIMKSFNSGSVAPYSPVEVQDRFGGS